MPKRIKLPSFHFILEASQKKPSITLTITYGIKGQWPSLRGQQVFTPTKEISQRLASDKLLFEQWLAEIARITRALLQRQIKDINTLSLDFAIAKVNSQFGFQPLHPSDFGKQAERAIRIPARIFKHTLGARRKGRPQETADEFLNKVAITVRKLGVSRPRQTAVAELLGCEPRYLRRRLKKHGFKNWAKTLTAIRKKGTFNLK